MVRAGGLTSALQPGLLLSRSLHVEAKGKVFSRDELNAGGKQPVILIVFPDSRLLSVIVRLNQAQGGWMFGSRDLSTKRH